jgi:type II secretory pathway predicted ATPase ExeA/cell division septation protein DedD
VPQPVSPVVPQDPGSLTYEPYFGLREKPFSLSADPRFFFRNSSHGATFDALHEGIRRREGILVLTGEVGTGKTTVCRAVLQALDRKTFAAFVPDPFLSREDLLKTLLVDFGVVSMDDVRAGRLRGASRTDLSYPLYEFLTSLQPLQAFAVVMIDEAQNLATALLEEIRILSDLENRQKLLEVVLVGQPELQSHLATPFMRQLGQRVSTRCDLPPLARGDVRPYITHRLTIAGDNGTIELTDAAIELVCAASRGIPRVINLVCDRALSYAARCRTMKVDAEHITWAVDELKLPAARSSREWDRAGPSLESFPPERPEAPAEREPRETQPLRRETQPPRRETQLQPRESQPQPRDEGVLPTADPIVLVPGPTTAGPSIAVRDRLPDSDLGEVFHRRVAEAPTPVLPMGVKVDLAATRRRRTRLLALALVTAVVAPTTALVAWYRMSPVPQEQTDVYVPPQPMAPRQASPQPPVATVNPPPARDDSSLDPGIKKTGATPAAPGAPVKSASPAGDHEPARSKNPVPGHTGVTKFVLQMATFQNPARAARSLQEFRDAGYHAYTVEVSLRDGERAIAVLVGPYAELGPAERDLAGARQIPGYGGGRIVQVGSPAPSTKPPS